MLAAAAMGLSSCEYEFDNGSLTKETSIYVEGRLSNSDTNVIRIVKTLPYNMKVAAKDSAALNVTAVSSLELLRDGSGQQVFYADEAVGSVPKGSYYTVGAFHPGEKVTLKAGMEGVKKVSAETVIPQDVNWEYEVAEAISEADAHNVFHITISFDNAPDTDEFYGIQVEVRSNVTFYNEDGTVNPYYGQDYIYALNPPVDDSDDDIESIMAGEGDSHVFEYENIYLCDDSSLRTGRNTIAYDAKLWGPYYYFGMARTKGGDDRDSGKPVKVRTLQEYRVTLYSLSRELYRWYASQYNAGYNPLAELGLCPPSFAYGNIKNGIGCFAGVCGTSSGWIVINDNWVDIDKALYY